MSEVKQRQKPSSPVRIKDNLFRYGAGTVTAAVAAGYFLQDLLPFAIIMFCGLGIGAVALVLESHEERRNAPKRQDMEDLQMLVMELTHEVKKLPPGYSPSSSKALESKLDQLEQEVKTLNPRQR